MKIEPFDDTKPFPLQRGKGFRRKNGMYTTLPACQIPWWLGRLAWLEYDTQCRTRQGQQGIADRAGFGREEFLFFLLGALKRLEGNPQEFMGKGTWKLIDKLVEQAREDKRK